MLSFILPFLISFVSISTSPFIPLYQMRLSGQATKTAGGLKTQAAPCEPTEYP
jgi:hypothetical protein